MENLKIIRTLPELKVLSEYIADKDYIAFDTETTGLSRESQVVGFSVCADTDTAYYVILSYYDTTNKALVNLETQLAAATFCQQLVGKKLIMHNAVFDCMIVQSNFKVELMPSVHTDTMILAQLLDENRAVGLKDLGVSIFGETAIKEQQDMKSSITKNGGECTRKNYELYKADADLIALYGAKDALLTLKLFYHLVEDLYEQGLQKFFYDEESMPLLRGPTYDLNTTGIKIDINRLMTLEKELQAECMEDKAFIDKELKEFIKDEYPGTTKKNTFNVDASQQRAWLLFQRLENDFVTLTNEGKELCKALDIRVPYAIGDKAKFIEFCRNFKGRSYRIKTFDKKAKRIKFMDKKVRDPWRYLACGEPALQRFSKKYAWVNRYLKYAKNLKILNTYVEGIKSRLQYGVIYPSFLQHGTTSGRYSSREPNFQNLPKNDKRVKSLIIPRPGKMFVGADYSQLEPRVFASLSQDEKLIACFASGEDFYSVIGASVFNIDNISLIKDDKFSFANQYSPLRDIAKVIALSATYGTTPFKMAPLIDSTTEEARKIIEDYFDRFPNVRVFMQSCHQKAMQQGFVKSLYGRPRRMPDAKMITAGRNHNEMPYEQRNLLNLAVNHTVQSTAASIMNRSAIRFYNDCKNAGLVVKVVIQTHDEIAAECDQDIADQVVVLMKNAMEKTVILPKVSLIAEPKIAKSLDKLK